MTVLPLLLLVSMDTSLMRVELWSEVWLGLDVLAKLGRPALLLMPFMKADSRPTTSRTRLSNSVRDWPPLPDFCSCSHFSLTGVLILFQ